MSHAEKLLRDGAHILDIGGESTRPGSPAVPLQQELERVLPVLAEAVKLQVPISIDTYKPEVMREALDMGWISSTTSGHCASPVPGRRSRRTLVVESASCTCMPRRRICTWITCKAMW